LIIDEGKSLLISSPFERDRSARRAFVSFIGWGLYSEYLGREMGVYDDDPVQLLGHYSYSLLRAARLVIAFYS